MPQYSCTVSHDGRAVLLGHIVLLNSDSNRQKSIRSLKPPVALLFHDPLLWTQSAYMATGQLGEKPTWCITVSLRQGSRMGSTPMHSLECLTLYVCHLLCVCVCNIGVWRRSYRFSGTFCKGICASLSIKLSQGKTCHKQSTATKIWNLYEKVLRR